MSSINDRQIPHGYIIGIIDGRDCHYTKSWWKRIWYDWGVCEVLQ